MNGRTDERMEGRTDAHTHTPTHTETHNPNHAIQTQTSTIATVSLDMGITSRGFLVDNLITGITHLTALQLPEHVMEMSVCLLDETH